MSALSIEQVLGYVNEARTNPKKFSQYVKKEIDSFLNEMSLPLYPGCTYSTNQGKKVWKETYEFLQKHKPLPALQLNEGLNLSAMDHAIDMQKNNFFGHQSSNGMSFSERIQRRCGKCYGASAQNLGNEFDVKGRNHALQTVLGLIIDDGVPNRGHRVNIFNQEYKYIGIYSVKCNGNIYTCMNFHSAEVQPINTSKNPLTEKNKGSSESKPTKIVSKQYGSKFDDDFNKQFEKMSLNNKMNGAQLQSNGNKGEKYVASKSTSTKTSTKNGKTTKVTTTKIKYSDGSTEEHVEQSTY